MDLTIRYREIQCPCGLRFAIPEEWAKQKENDHEIFYCPACKEGWYYPKETENERLERLLESERDRCLSAREDANYFEKRAQGYKGYATKLKKRLTVKEKNHDM